MLCVDPDGGIREIGGVQISRFGKVAPARTPLPDNWKLGAPIARFFTDAPETSGAAGACEAGRSVLGAGAAPTARTRTLRTTPVPAASLAAATMRALISVGGAGN
ncbi:hypothetical protein ACFC09_43605 [Streptomyces sp. NPDC056161]|uniref:hypothetical protein n=1 Tax=Streptomyces sp. NPDC056161 TaxID=3345732 RepID=UPI0035DF0006